MNIKTGFDNSCVNTLLSIIIVNYNGKRFLADCLQSIAKNVTCSHEIIIVDNASSDGSADFIKHNFQAITLIENPENSGFSIGNNIGAKVAKGKYLLLLNNDTLLLTNVVPGIDLLETRPEIGIVGAMMLGRDNEYRFSAGYFPAPLRLIKISSLYRRDGPFRDGAFSFASAVREYYPVDWVEGSFLLTPADVWGRLAGLDEDCFMYGEDVDYCKRAKLSGYICVYKPDIQFNHYGGYGSGRLSLVVTGFLRYHKRHSGIAIQTLVFTILAVKLAVTNIVNRLRFFISGTPVFRERADSNMQALRVVFGRK